MGSQLRPHESFLVIAAQPILGARRDGWTVAGDVEYALTNNWLLRAEYLYFDFRNHLIFDFGQGNTQFGHPKFHVGQVGLSYKFDWGAPIAR
jgi:opacity protein-like surface antigen